jgi:tetratricopeptide (TPR) repeat protein
MSPFQNRHHVGRPIVRSRSSGYSFVSYSSKDWPIVSKLVNALKGDRVWVDKRTVELGDALPEKVESGIGGAASFILVLSKASLESRWVKYESHMAVIRHLEDANFRILVLKIDECHVPLRFRPFLYADLSKDAGALDLIVRAASSKDPPGALYRRLFVNRNDDLGRIESHVADPDKSLICLQGFYGIGKRTLAEESIRRTWQSPKIVAIELSAAHRGSRLSAALCAAAGMPVPVDGTPDEEIRKASLMAVERLIEQKRVIILDHLEYLLDDEGKPHADISAVIDHISGIPASFDIPCYLLTRRLPKLQSSSALRAGYVRVSGMRMQHIVTILESEAARISRKPVKASAAFRKLAEHLFGYPLAGRLAAPLLVKYSPEYLLENLAHITSLRRDIAEAILANTDFTGEQTRILQLLAMSDGSLSVEDLASMSGTSADSVVDSIDTLADHNLLESERASVRLHPLVADFYWKQARAAPEFRTIVSRIADHALGVLKREKPDTVRFVNWLATACRALFLSDREAEARALRRDFSGELKLAAIELYQRGDYDISLRYCEAYLEHDPTDFEVNLHRARNLSRLARPDDSLKAIDAMTRTATSPHQRARLHFARGRVFWETRKIELARSEYVKALDLNPKLLPALQGVADSLMAESKTDDASGFVERALKVSPMDSHSLSTKAEIFWRRGKWRDAVETMEVVVRAQPENATFLFRLGRFLQQSNLLEQAREYFRRAKAADQTFTEPRLSLASTAIDLGGLDEAKAEIDSLRGRLPADKRFVLDEIEAKYHLALGDLEAAATLADKALAYHRNAFTLSLMAKIEAALQKEAQQNGMTVAAESHRTRALTLIAEGLNHEPASSVLLSQKKALAGAVA